MEIVRGKKKYRWTRWPSIIFTIAVTVLGGFMIYWVNTIPELHTVWYMVWGLGLALLAIGISSSLHEYFDGVTYISTSKWPLDQLDKLNGSFIKFDNALVIDIGGHARLITYNYEQIFSRGYIKIKVFYDRHKRMKNYHILSE